MKYIKTFEKNQVNQQPFYLIGNTLYISNKIVKKITEKPHEIRKRFKHNTGYVEHFIRYNDEFYNNIKYEKGYFKQHYAFSNIKVSYGMGFDMEIRIYRGSIHDNEFGHFQYYIGGRCGSYEMHTDGMIRVTKECNLNLMKKLYPIIKPIKNFYKRLLIEGFIDIIKNEIIKDNSLIQYGVPSELTNDEEVEKIILINKYNI